MSDESGCQQPSGQDVTRLLHRAADGDAGAAAALLPLVYEKLRARDGACLRFQPANHTLQPTAVVHEACLKLVNSPSPQWNSRAHSCSVAATAVLGVCDSTVKKERRRVRAWLSDELESGGVR